MAAIRIPHDVYEQFNINLMIQQTHLIMGELMIEDDLNKFVHKNAREAKKTIIRMKEQWQQTLIQYGYGKTSQN